MSDRLNNAIEILQHLVGFDSISGKPNVSIVSYIVNYLTTLGVEFSPRLARR